MPQFRLGEGPYGSAYAGTIDDLVGCGDLAPVDLYGRTFGLYLGQFDWVQATRHVWQEPQQGILAWFKDLRTNREFLEEVPQTEDLRFTGDHHHLIVASTGSGKFRDVLSNMLLYDGSCETACLIIDPKGEIASTIGPMIDEPGVADPRTVILDPWNVCKTGMTDGATLLDGIRADNPHCVKDARVLADAIIIERNADDGHWAATASSLLASLLLLIGLDPLEEGDRDLFRLREVITLPPEKFEKLLNYMKSTDYFEGLVSRSAQAYLNRDKKEQRAILSTLERDTAFVEDPGLWSAIRRSTFDMRELVLSNKRLHVIVPFDYTSQMKSWLRLTIAAFYNACLRAQLPSQLPQYLRFRHIIIDEFAGLGKLNFLMKDIAEARGAGVKYHLAVQDFVQLRNLYDNGWETFISNSFVQAFGTNDVFTADYLSKMTGQATVITKSTSFTSSTSVSSSTSQSKSQGGTSGSSQTGSSQTRSTTTGESTTFSSVGRAVLMSDEIRRLPDDQQLLFIRQMPAIISRRTHYYQTFASLLPRHSLREIMASKAVTSTAMLGVDQSTGLTVRSARALVRPAKRMPSFSIPPFRPYTFKEALQQSPVFGLSLLAFLGILAYMIVSGLNEAAIRQKAVDDDRRASALATAAAEEEAVAAAKQRQQAQVINDQIKGPYAALAGVVYGAMARNGVCSTVETTTPDFACSVFAAYRVGDVTPLSARFNVQRKEFAEISLAPANEKKGSSFNGAIATFDVQSVFEHVDLRQRDEAGFYSAVHNVILSTLEAFRVPEQTLRDCESSSEVSQTVNGTTVSCQFLSRPMTNGGLASFKLVLSRPL